MQRGRETVPVISTNFDTSQVIILHSHHFPYLFLPSLPKMLTAANGCNCYIDSLSQKDAICTCFGEQFDTQTGTYLSSLQT
ncbi:hypothetical protein FKM82_014143 [Ascaphus truei]